MIHLEKINQLVSEFNDSWCLKTVAAWSCLNCQWSPLSKSPTHVHNIVPTHHNPATLAMWQEFPLIVPKSIQIESIFNLTNHGDWTGKVEVSNLATPRSTPLELSEAIPALAKCLFVVIRFFSCAVKGDSLQDSTQPCKYHDIIVGYKQHACGRSYVFSVNTYPYTLYR